jgi:serine/threonine protein phosphatase PrpC
VAGRASIVGAAATHVGKVREHNEDAHFLDAEQGVFLVCDGMGGHAAGEVASAIAVEQICREWSSVGVRDVAEQWLARGTPAAKKDLLDVVRGGVHAAHRAILAEAVRDRSKSGMGTTLVGAIVIGGELVFAHAGDSRAYLVRDGIAMQLTEDHTLLARLLAAGIDVDVSGEGSRFRSMLTNALGIGDEVKVSTFVVPLADGDRFMLCSDGVSEYVPEAEVGEVLSKQASPARAAQKLIDLALERGGGDNATAVVVRVLEAGETPQPADQRRKDDAAIARCALWGRRVTPQQRLRALRIASPRDHAVGDKLPPHTLGDRVAWIVVEGEVVQDGAVLGPGAILYPESLTLTPVGDPPPLPERDALAVARGDVRALAIRADDFRELCEDDGELGEALLDGLAQAIAKAKRPRPRLKIGPPSVDPRGATDPHLPLVGKTIDAAAVEREIDDEDTRDRAATVPDDPSKARPWPKAESPVIAPVEQAPSRPSPLPSPLTKRVAPPPPGPMARPSPLPAQLTARPAAPPAKVEPPAPAPAPAAPAEPVKPAPRKTAHVAPRATPTTGIAPVSAPVPAATPTSIARPDPEPAPAPVKESSWPSPSDWDELTERIGPPRRRSTTATPVKAFAPAPPVHVAAGTATMRRRPPTEPEIETYLELEADLPPSFADDHQLEPRAFGSTPRAPRPDLDDEPEISITIEAPRASEPAADEPAPRRSKRHTSGWDE